MENWVAKVIAMLVTFILPLTCTLIAYPMAGYIDKKGQLGQIVICRLMCYGGGIFFGTFLLHMGPEVRIDF
jgi:zinc transporter 1/2/3